jgi:hypothetical protein
MAAAQTAHRKRRRELEQWQAEREEDVANKSSGGLSMMMTSVLDNSSGRQQDTRGRRKHIGP